MNENIVYGYVLGIVLIGLPMSLISLWCYSLEEELDRHWYYWPLKIVRNILHPGSFMITPEYEHETRSNYRSNYEGPIGFILDSFVYELEVHRVVFYIILSSTFWPVRVVVTVAATALILFAIAICFPFFILYLLWKGGCLLFRVDAS